MRDVAGTVDRGTRRTASLRTAVEAHASVPSTRWNEAGAAYAARSRSNRMGEVACAMDAGVEATPHRARGGGVPQIAGSRAARPGPDALSNAARAAAALEDHDA